MFAASRRVGSVAVREAPRIAWLLLLCALVYAGLMLALACTYPATKLLHSRRFSRLIVLAAEQPARAQHGEQQPDRGRGQ